MKISIFIIFSLLFTSLPFPVFAAADTVDKTICKLAVGYQDVDEIQADLLAAAKREVINELFGEMIVASTAVENFVVTSDQIRTSSIGFVRVDGNADFFNGTGFAEVCVTIHAYVTAEDRAKFKPERLEKKYCDADDNLTTSQLIAYVKDEAVIQALVEYSPKLKVADKDKLLQLVQKVTYLENGFIPDTQTYCARFEGYVVSVEVMAFLGTDSSAINTEPSRGERMRQWASKVHSFSSQYNNDGWSAKQVLGEPNITGCGDIAGSWTTNATGTQFIEVGFEKIVYPEKLIIRQNNAVGFVTRLEFFRSDGSSESIEVTDRLTDCPGESEFQVGDAIDFPTNQVKVYINASHSGYEEIDAIALEGVELIEEAHVSENSASTTNNADKIDTIDISGTWTWTVNGERRLNSDGTTGPDSNSVKAVVTLKSNGENLSGKFISVEQNFCAQADVIDGTINGNQVSWIVHFTGSCCQNAEMAYTGTIDRETMTIVGTMEPVAAPGSGCYLWWGNFSAVKE